MIHKLSACAVVFLFASASASAAIMTPVTNGLVIAYDGSNVTTAVSAVTSWNDQATAIAEAGTNNAIQATATKQPVLTAGVINGQAAVTFSGNNSTTTTTNGDVLVSNYTPSVTDSLTIFSVFRRGTQTTDTGSILRPLAASGIPGTAVGARGFSFAPRRESAPTDLQFAFGNADFAATGVLGSTNYHIAVGRADITNDLASLFVDGPTPDATAALTIDLATPTPISIGGSDTAAARFFIGPIAEVLIYNRALTDAEINEVGVYLEQKYGLDTAFAPVPEPTSIAMLGLGAIGLSVLRRRALR